MSIFRRFLPSSIFIGLLACGAAILAQEQVEPGRPEAAEHGNADAAEVAEFAQEAQHHYPRESFASWMIRSSGMNGLLVLVAGLCCFVVALVVVMRGQGPFAIAALVFVVPIPLLIGLFGAGQGLIMSLQLIGMSSTTPRPSEVFGGIATALFNPMLGLVAMLPSYLVAMLGAIFRSFATPAVKS